MHSVYKTESEIDTMIRSKTETMEGTGLGPGSEIRVNDSKNQSQFSPHHHSQLHQTLF